jgi:hypothetical protein
MPEVGGRSRDDAALRHAGELGVTAEAHGREGVHMISGAKPRYASANLLDLACQHRSQDWAPWSGEADENAEHGASSE